MFSTWKEIKWSANRFTFAFASYVPNKNESKILDISHLHDGAPLFFPIFIWFGWAGLTLTCARTHTTPDCLRYKRVQQKAAYSSFSCFYFSICVLFHHKHQCVGKTNWTMVRIKADFVTVFPFFFLIRRAFFDIFKKSTCIHVVAWVCRILTWKRCRQTRLDPAKMWNCLFQNFQHHGNWCDCATKNSFAIIYSSKHMHCWIVRKPNETHRGVSQTRICIVWRWLQCQISSIQPKCFESIIAALNIFISSKKHRKAFWHWEEVENPTKITPAKMGRTKE